MLCTVSSWICISQLMLAGAFSYFEKLDRQTKLHAIESQINKVYRSLVTQLLGIISSHFINCHHWTAKWKLYALICHSFFIFCKLHFRTTNEIIRQYIVCLHWKLIGHSTTFHNIFMFCKTITTGPRNEAISLCLMNRHIEVSIESWPFFIHFTICLFSSCFVKLSLLDHQVKLYDGALQINIEGWPFFIRFTICCSFFMFWKLWTSDHQMKLYNSTSQVNIGGWMFFIHSTICHGFFMFYKTITTRPSN